MSRLPDILKRGRQGLFVRLIVIGFIQVGVMLTTVMLVRHIFDHVMGASLGTDMLWIGVFLIMMGLYLAWLRRAEYGYAEHMGQDYVDELRLKLFDRMRNSSLRSFQLRSRGAVMLRFIGDLNSVRRWISLGLARLTVGSITLVGAAGVLSVMSWRLGLAAIVVIMLGLWGLMLRGHALQLAVRATRRRRSQMASNIYEKVNSLAVMQLFDRDQRESRRIVKQSGRVKSTAVYQAWITGSLRGISEATTALAGTAVLIVGAMEVSAGRLTTGAVVAALSIVGLLTPSLRDLARVYEYWQSYLVAREKLSNFLGLPGMTLEPHDALDLKIKRGQVRLSSISVGTALHEVTAHVKGGEVVAIIGPNGAGKSTLLSTIARLIDTDHGEIHIDGQRITDCTISSLRRTVSMLSPDLPLQRGTIKRNLCYRWPKAPPEELERVIRLCGLDEITRELPKGLDTKIQEGGSNLSLGQRQRIALARAILGDPPILLLDEADGNLDSSASLILDHVIKQYAGTVIIVTHRLELAARADTLWYLENGRLIDTGAPEAVLSRRELPQLPCQQRLRSVS